MRFYATFYSSLPHTLPKKSLVLRPTTNRTTNHPKRRKQSSGNNTLPRSPGPEQKETPLRAETAMPLPLTHPTNASIIEPRRRRGGDVSGQRKHRRPKRVFPPFSSASPRNTNNNDQRKGGVVLRSTAGKQRPRACTPSSKIELRDPMELYTTAASSAKRCSDSRWHQTSARLFPASSKKNNNRHPGC